MTSRLQPKTYAELTPAQQAQYDRIRRARAPRPDGQFGGPFDPWIRSPEVAERAMSLGNFIWERTSVGRRIVELAIIVTGRLIRRRRGLRLIARLVRPVRISCGFGRFIFNIAGGALEQFRRSRRRGGRGGALGLRGQVEAFTNVFDARATIPGHDGPGGELIILSDHRFDLVITINRIVKVAAHFLTRRKTEKRFHMQRPAKIFFP